MSNLPFIPRLLNSIAKRIGKYKVVYDDQANKQIDFKLRFNQVKEILSDNRLAVT